MSHTEMSSLRLQLESLPQELYDKIYNQVFTASKAMDLIKVWRGLRPAHSHLLHVDRTSRAQYAKSYYTNTTFVFDGLRDALIPWLLNIPREEVQWIEKLAYELNERSLKSGLFQNLAQTIVAGDFGTSVARKVGVIARSEVKERMGNNYINVGL